MKRKQAKSQKEENRKATLSKGFLRVDPGLFYRKKWAGYMYLNKAGELDDIDIFRQNRMLMKYKKICMLSKDQRWAFYFCRVPKDMAALFESCLFQLNTVLSHDEDHQEIIHAIIRWFSEPEVHNH